MKANAHLAASDLFERSGIHKLDCETRPYVPVAKIPPAEVMTFFRELRHFQDIEAGSNLLEIRAPDAIFDLLGEGARQGEVVIICGFKVYRDNHRPDQVMVVFGPNTQYL